MRIGTGQQPAAKLGMLSAKMAEILPKAADKSTPNGTIQKVDLVHGRL